MARPKAPWFPMFADEFLNDPGVRCLTLEESGFFVDFLCLTFLSPIRGAAVFGDSSRIPPEFLLNSYVIPRLNIGIPPEKRPQEAQKILDKLLQVGLIRQSPDGILFNKRLLLYLTDWEVKSLKGKELSVYIERVKKFLPNYSDIPTKFLRNSSRITPDRCRRKNKEVDVSNTKTKSSCPKNEFSDEVTSLTNLLISKILTNDAKAKTPPLSENGVQEPKWQKWARDADLLLRVDGRPFREAEQLIHWCQDSVFWRANIRSMGKFREQYPQLRLKWKAEQEWQPQEKETESDRIRRLTGG